MTPRPIAALAVVIVIASGCPGAQRRSVVIGGGQETPPAPPGVVSENKVLDVALADGRTARMGALLLKPDAGGRYPTVVVVPGGGNPSRAGVRPGDGLTNYPKPVPVALKFGEALAKSGHVALLYDKRTCAPQDAQECGRNPSDDVDESGPLALAKDIDAACALAKSDPASDGRIVLWAHGQAAQVALSSSCAQEAAAFVLVAPIPRAIDDVMADALKERSRATAARAEKEADPAKKQKLSDEAMALKNEAGSLEATFQGIDKGRFEKSARVRGATLSFWLSWIALTKKTGALVDATERPILVVVGQRDAQFSSKDRERMLALGKPAAPASTPPRVRRALLVPGADHHLLVGGAFSDEAAATVIRALDEILGPAGPPPT